ncbi:ISL3 family transposase [Mycoplasmatota bacterium]|nr:ISL3 family transposase [Mycoplasmatota bacterium]
MNKSEVKYVCIDDFAIKKRKSYGTIMVDIETKCIIDLLESRDSMKVTEWLTTFPNIKLVSRDGSTTYRSAIADAHPKATQVSDRFHLVKNLVKSISKYMKRIITGRIEIPLISQDGKKRYDYLCGLSRREKIIEARRLYAKEGNSYDTIGNKLGVSPTTVAKYIKMREEDIPKEKITVRGKEHINAISKVEQKRNKVLELWNKGYTKRDISKKTGYSTTSIDTYLKGEFNPVHGQYGTGRNGKLMPFRDEVIDMRANGITYKKITEHIREKGYTGTVDGLRFFISKEKRLAKDTSSTKEPTEFLDKRLINKLLYKPLEKVKGITENQLNEFFKKYPDIKVLFERLKEFRLLLLEDTEDSLSKWIKRARESEIQEIDSFINGIQNDQDAVENAIKYSYNNGLAEGSVNKLKSIKRIMYGRNKFDLLRSKVLLLESLK